MQATRQPFISEATIRRSLAKSKRLGNAVEAKLLQDAVDKIETRRQWRKQRGGRSRADGLYSRACRNPHESAISPKVSSIVPSPRPPRCDDPRRT